MTQEREREKRKLDDGLEMKYSVMEREQNEQEYTPQWDPDILADLQANVHNHWLDEFILTNKYLIIFIPFY